MLSPLKPFLIKPGESFEGSKQLTKQAERSLSLPEPLSALCLPSLLGASWRLSISSAVEGGKSTRFHSPQSGCCVSGMLKREVGSFLIRGRAEWLSCEKPAARHTSSDLLGRGNCASPRPPADFQGWVSCI